MNGQRHRLVLFTRFPEPGKVKTRLIPVLGPEGAAALHHLLVLRTLRTAAAACRSCPAELEIRFDGGEEEAMHRWLGHGWRCRPQCEGDLGQRMARAFEDGFREGASAIVIIGSDCPALTAEILAIAFEKLQTGSVVLGPAADGGYYLIGLVHPAPELFSNITWGSDSVFRESLGVIARLGLKCALLDRLDDIDRPADLVIWRQLIEQEKAGPPPESMENSSDSRRRDNFERVNHAHATG